MAAADERNQVPGNDPWAQLEELRKAFPELYSVIDRNRLEEWSGDLAAESATRDDFGPGGRGTEYLQAQALDVHARATGISQLVRLLMGTPAREDGRPRIMVDLLGGDGLVRRVCREAALGQVSILTCDLSPYMIASAWSQGLPALIQRAERPLLKDSSVDAVLLAYGSHHIPAAMRQALVSQAYRVLRPGGVFVLHDFLCGSPADRWFSDVVDPYSATGHKFRHFTSNEVNDCLTGAGFTRHEVLDLNDSYSVTGASRRTTESAMGRYLVKMYGLTKAESTWGPEGASRWALSRARSIFTYREPGSTIAESDLRFDNVARAWRMRIPRRAVVGVGEKGDG